MIFGLGIDVVDTDRFTKYSDIKHPFLKKVFSKKELNYCFSRDKPFLHLAGKFAAKEATFKAFSQYMTSTPRDLNIEVLNDDFGIPYVLTNKDTSNLSIKLSVSHDGKIATAVVLIIEN